MREEIKAEYINNYKQMTLSQLEAMLLDIMDKGSSGYKPMTFNFIFTESAKYRNINIKLTNVVIW